MSGTDGACRRCELPATRIRLVRLGSRQWRVPLCDQHSLTLSMMISGWVGDVEQDRPVAPPPRMSPVHPLSGRPRAVARLREEPKPLPRNVPPAAKTKPQLRVIRTEEDLQERL